MAHRTTAMPQRGDAAPGFALPDEYGGVFRLSEALGESRVLLVFYPFAFSPVCGTELRALEELRTSPTLVGHDAPRIAAVSTDSKYALAAWAGDRGTGFDLLSDFWPHGAAARAYGVFDAERGMAQRGTFLIGRDGIIERAELGPVDQVRDFAQWLTQGRSH